MIAICPWGALAVVKLLRTLVQLWRGLPLHSLALATSFICLMIFSLLPLLMPYAQNQLNLFLDLCSYLSVPTALDKTLGPSTRGLSNTHK